MKQHALTCLRAACAPAAAGARAADICGLLAALRRPQRRKSTCSASPHRLGSPHDTTRIAAATADGELAGLGDSEARARRLAALVVGRGRNHAQPHRAPPGPLLEIAATLEGLIAGAVPWSIAFASVSSSTSLDFYDAELRAHHEHLRAAYGISPGDDVVDIGAEPG